jgi:Zn-dependent protease
VKQILFRKLGGVISPFEILLFLASLGLASMQFRWEFAFAFIGGLLVHELGHVVAMRAYGVRIKGMYFIFPLGAVIVPIGSPPTRFSEAVIGLAGPAAGLLTAFVALAVFSVTGEPLAVGIAGVFAFFNLFNLLPARPLDGGRAATALAYSVSDFAGLAVQGIALIACAYFGMLYLPILLLVALFGMGEWRHELYRSQRADDRKGVIAALAKLYGCPPDANAVCDAVDRYQANVVAFTDEQALDARRRTFRDSTVEPDDPDLARAARLAVPTVIAATGRKGRIPLFATQAVFVTNDAELQAWPPPSTQESPLRKFLTEKTLPRMNAPAAIATCVAYAALVVLLAGAFLISNGYIGFIDFLRYVSR